MRFKFVCEEHKEYGSKGWRLKSQPDFDPLGGMAVAHDCLEHFTDSADPADGFMALGASLFVRGFHYYSIKGKYEVNPGAHIASDLPDIWDHIINEGMDLRNAPRTSKLDEEIESQIDLMFSAYYRELNWNNEGRTSTWTQKDKRNIRSWMRIGYRKASRRYRGDGRGACQLFLDVEEKADKFLKYAEEGMTELIVTLNLRDLTAKVTTKDRQKRFTAKT